MILNGRRPSCFCFPNIEVHFYKSYIRCTHAIIVNIIHNTKITCARGMYLLGKTRLVYLCFVMYVFGQLMWRSAEKTRTTHERRSYYVRDTRRKWPWNKTNSRKQCVKSSWTYTGQAHRPTVGNVYKSPTGTVRRLFYPKSYDYTAPGRLKDKSYEKTLGNTFVAPASRLVGY